MDEPISEEQLREWERLAADATPGEWKTQGCLVHTTTPHRQVISTPGSFITTEAAQANAAFIAASHSAVPALVAEVRRLRAELRALLSSKLLPEVAPDEWIPLIVVCPAKGDGDDG